MNPDHICVCICTFRRPKLLARLLESLDTVGAGSNYTYSVVVVDNDRERSALSIVEEARARGITEIEYQVVSEPNIAEARNAAVAASTGDYIAFIDDDELPEKYWLSRHLENIKKTNAAASLGPVIPYFETVPPKWLVKGGFCQRERVPTGTKLHWGQTRTGNALVDRRLVLKLDPPFDPSYAYGGEDKIFFRSMSEHGAQFVWCDEALVYELVPQERCRASYFLKRAFLQGAISSRYYRGSYSTVDRVLIAGKSMTALFIYSLLLPLAAARGFAEVLKVLIKGTHHLSRFLTTLGLYKVEKRNFT